MASNFMGFDYKWMFDGIGVAAISVVFFAIKYVYGRWGKPFLTKKTKQNVKILFIDNKAPPIVDLLRSADYGYPNVSRISDVEGPEDPRIHDVDIFFVDIHGIGKKIGKEERGGFGVVEFLKDKYPKSKIVIYSGESVPSDPAYSMADKVMTKESTGYELNKVIEDLISQL